MNYKNAARKLGKQIRSTTGIPFTSAMTIAKYRVRGKPHQDIPEPARSFVLNDSYTIMDMGCPEEYSKTSIVGPKGKMVYRY